MKSGNSDKATEAPSGSDEEIEDGRSVKQLIAVNFDYAFNPEWSLSLNLPFVLRRYCGLWGRGT